MNKRKSLILVIAIVSLVSILLVSLTGCLKIGLKQKNVEERIVENGGEFKYLKANPFAEETSNQLNIDSMFRATIPIKEVEREAYIFYCGDDETTEKVKDQADEFLKTKRAEETEIIKQLEEAGAIIDSEAIKDYEHYVTYQYDRVVMCGYFEVVSIIRTY